jgi:hypothetical protein
MYHWMTYKIYNKYKQKVVSIHTRFLTLLYMSPDGGYFGSRSGSLNTILEVDNLRTIDDMFAILAFWFRGKHI